MGRHRLWVCNVVEKGIDGVHSEFHYEWLGFKKVVGREGVSYHITLIVNIESDKWKSLHLGIATWT